MAPPPAITLFDPPNLADSRPSYSHVAKISNPTRIIYTAGQVGADKEGKTPTSFEGQAKQAFSNLKHALETAGASVRDITKLTFYIVDWEHNEASFGGPLMEFLTDSNGVHRCPSTLISISALASPEWKVEVEAVAAISERLLDPAQIVSTTPDYTLKSVDVVVVGAGLSGLQAALDIQKAGFTCVVLEARDRVGGKTFSKTLASGKGVVDVGAAWLNNRTQPKIYALAKKYGFDTVVQPTAGESILQDDSGKCERVGIQAFSSSQMKVMETVARIHDKIDVEAAKLDLRNLAPSEFDEITVDEFIRQNGAEGDSYKLIEALVKGLLGVDATELSLHYYLDYIKSGGNVEELGSDESNGAQHMRLRQGMQSISKALAGDLQPGSLFLESPVSNIIQQSKSKCIVTTHNGLAIAATKVIISIPTPLYRTINFSPPLPQAKAALTNSTTLGYYAKTILIYSKPWWRDIGLNASFTSLNGVVSFSRDTSVDVDKQFSITCFLVGGTGRKWSILSPLARRQAVLDQIALMIGDENKHLVYETEEIIEQEWIKEQWSQGAPSPVMGPGLLNKYADVLRAPVGNIHFVGTETAFEWKGYMNGAVSSGERGAEEVIQELEKPIASRL